MGLALEKIEPLSRRCQLTPPTIGIRQLSVAALSLCDCAEADDEPLVELEPPVMPTGGRLIEPAPPVVFPWAWPLADDAVTTLFETPDSVAGPKWRWKMHCQSEALPPPVPGTVTSIGAVISVSTLPSSERS